MCPFLNVWNRVVLRLDKSLIDERPTTDVGRQMCTSRIASPVLVHTKDKKERENELSVSYRGIHDQSRKRVSMFSRGDGIVTRLYAGPHIYGSGMGGMLFIFDSDDGFLYSSFLFNGFRVLRTRHWQQLVEFKSGGFISECHFYGSARSSRPSLAGGPNIRQLGPRAI